MSAGSSPKPLSAEAAEKAGRLPAPAQLALRRFQEHHDPADLDCVLFALMEDAMPRRPATEFSQLPGGTRLIEDLHCDSLTLAELVFSLEDFFGIRVKNEEIVNVHTLDDLRACVRQKLASLPAARS